MDSGMADGASPPAQVKTEYPPSEPIIAPEQPKDELLRDIKPPRQPKWPGAKRRQSSIDHLHTVGKNAFPPKKSEASNECEDSTCEI